MREFRQEVRGTLIGVVLYWLVGSGLLYMMELTTWLAGFALGCASGAVHYILLAMRLSRAAEMSAKRAMMFMRVGFILRFVFVALVLVFASQVSRIFFASCAVGVIGLYAVQTTRALANGVRSLNKN
ncbi:MAG: hypothetical protein IIX11_05225 [Selenomonadales bacterium]|nr:hypothetical protein [Selenomonadales bacterium]